MRVLKLTYKRRLSGSLILIGSLVFILTLVIYKFVKVRYSNESQTSKESAGECETVGANKFISSGKRKPRLQRSNSIDEAPGADIEPTILRPQMAAEESKDLEQWARHSDRPNSFETVIEFGSDDTSCDRDSGSKLSRSQVWRQTISNILKLKSALRLFGRTNSMILDEEFLSRMEKRGSGFVDGGEIESKEPEYLNSKNLRKAEISM